MNGAAAHWLILARSSGSESELSAVRFSTYSFVGGIHERTLRSRHASLRRTGHRRNRSSPILNYQAPGTRPDFSRYHEMSIIANRMLLFLCCERSRNMGGHRSSGLHQLRIEYEYEKRGHDGRHGLVGGGEREAGITYRLRRDNPERLPPGRSASRLPWCTRRLRCSRRHDGLP